MTLFLKWGRFAFRRDKRIWISQNDGWPTVGQLLDRMADLTDENATLHARVEASANGMDKLQAEIDRLREAGALLDRAEVVFRRSVIECVSVTHDEEKEDGEAITRALHRDFTWWRGPFPFAEGKTLRDLLRHPKLADAERKYREETEKAIG